MTSDNDPFANPPSSRPPAQPPQPVQQPVQPAAAPQPPLAPGMLAGAPAPQYSAVPTPYVAPVAFTRPAGGFATTAIVLTGAYAAYVLMEGVRAQGVVERTKESVTNPDNLGATGDLGDSAIALLGSMIGAIAFVFLALWMARIRSNLKATGSPVGGPPAVEWWGWFVPLANFVLPYLGMRALTRRSVGLGVLLGWWLPFCAYWLLYWISSFSSLLVVNYSTGKITHPEYLDNLVPLAWGSAVMLPVAWIFLVVIIRKTTARHLDSAA